VLTLPGDDGRVDLKKLLKTLGEEKIDSILLEGGGTLNDSALRQGLVQEVKAFVAPKIFGGQLAKTPVSGLGVEVPAQAVELTLENISKAGDDLLLEYRTGR
jgi:diaminohydroxyphosphoribosylaminopyrimidine deaminase/5-amino-6-(5-phosphoribosylamino)uracil reductase